MISPDEHSRKRISRQVQRRLAVLRPCSDVEVVFARGTFEAPGTGATGQAFVDALNARLGGNTVESYGVDYPATLDFQAAANGVADAANKVQAIAASCANTQIVLGGYTQGAAVAGYTTTDTVPAGTALPEASRVPCRPQLRRTLPRS
jgi:cutinase-like protein